MTLSDVLNQACAGDRMTVTRTNMSGGLYSVVSGPVLAAPGLDCAVGIDLLDGEPHIVRRADGQVFGDITSLTITREGRQVAVYERHLDPEPASPPVHSTDLLDERDKRPRTTNIGRVLWWCQAGRGWTFNPSESHLYHDMHYQLTLAEVLHSRPNLTITGWK